MLRYFIIKKKITKNYTIKKQHFFKFSIYADNICSSFFFLINLKFNVGKKVEILLELTLETRLNFS